MANESNNQCDHGTALTLVGGLT